MGLWDVALSAAEINAVYINGIAGVYPPVNEYEAWMSNYGLSVSNTAMTANPDGDALDNLAEYALGGNPTNAADIGILPAMGAVNVSVLEYIHRQRSDHAARGLTYSVEATTNMVSGTWTTNGVSITGSAPAEIGFESVTNEISTSTEPEQFIRLKIISE